MPARDLTPEFYSALATRCVEIKCEPIHLLSVWMYESGCHPAARNPSSNASGLCQLMPSNLLGVGWTGGPEAFRQLSAVEQLPYVCRYYRPYTGQLTSVAACYVATWMPADLPHAGDPAFVLSAKGGRRAWAYAPNASFDANHDYQITVGELVQAVARACTGERWAMIRAAVTAPSNVMALGYTAHVEGLFDP